MQGCHCPGPGNKRRNLIVLPASKEAESPSNPFSSVQFRPYSAITLNRLDMCSNLIAYLGITLKIVKPKMLCKLLVVFQDIAKQITWNYLVFGLCYPHLLYERKTHLIFFSTVLCNLTPPKLYLHEVQILHIHQNMHIFFG